MQRTYNANINAPEKLCVCSLALVIRCANRIISTLYYSMLSTVVCLFFPHYFTKDTIFGKDHFSVQFFFPKTH